MRPSLRDVALGVTPAFSLGLAFGLGKIVRDCSLTCSVGYEWAPVGILAIALVSLPVLDLHVRLEARFGFRALAVGAFLAAAASFLVFRALTFAAVSWYHDELAAGTVHASGTTVRAVYLLFFVWLGAIAAVLGANAKMAAVRLHPPSFRGAALAWGAAAVVAGGLLGSAVAGPAAQWMMGALDLRYEDARDTLFFGMAAAVLLPIPALLAIGRGPPSPMASVQTEAAAPARALPSSVWSELVRIVRMNPTRRLAGLIFVSGIAETMIVFVFYWIVTEQTSQVHGRTMFFATYYVYVNGATLLMLLFVTNRLVDRLGLLFAILSLPLALLFGTAVLLAHTALIVIQALRVVEEALEQALYDQSADRLVLAQTETKPRAARFILLGLVPRLGQGVGAVLVLTATHALPVGGFLVAYMGILVVWAAMALSLRRAMRAVREGMLA